ncbi:hypothetical protein [Streptomyces sp. TRM68367]|uniref:hypothetical protein n=1 Tax=Streptomyces sp. TRM68367 TaxID=2758415 RepID=UPI00165A7FA8|nr:hypothetical protein [Streptomyces sp. TRM68367]MBC9730530.1 hypothetical protein [Streptomyces sp. TRM68367]
MVQLERLSRNAGRTRLACQRVGAALLLYLQGELNPRVSAFAGGLAEDPEHTLVVVDLPEESPAAAWEAVAKMLRRRGRSFRVVIGRPSRETAMTVGQLLADRLGRTVLTPDGRMVAVVGGGLLVPEDYGTGWVAFQPRLPSWLLYSPPRPVPRVSRRFPVPTWDHAIPADSFPTSAASTAEPVPGGVWIRRTDQQRAGRDAVLRRLAATLLCPHDRLAVVLGCPGTAELPLQDIEGLWQRVPADIRPLARFIPYGPVEVPEGSTLGQALADRLDEAVTFYAGLPTVGEPGTGTAGPRVRLLGEDGTPGPPAFASELVYHPGGAAGAVPALRGHRQPVDGLPEVSTGVYQYSPDAVLEVTQSGLWLRPPVGPTDDTAVRRVPADPGGIVLHFDAGTPETAARMRRLAEEVRHKLDPAIGSVCRILPAPTTPAAPTTPTARGTAPEAGSAVPVGAAAEPKTEPAVPGAGPAVEPAASEPVPAMPSAGTQSAGSRPGPDAAPTTPAVPNADRETGGDLTSAAHNAGPDTGAGPAPAAPQQAAEPEQAAAPEAPPMASETATASGSEATPAEPAPLSAPQQQAPPPVPAPLRPGAIKLVSAPPTATAPAQPAADAAPRTDAANPAPSPAPQPGRPPTPGPTTQPAAPSPEPAPAPASPPAAPPKAAGTQVRVQPVPTPEACAAPPARGIEQERAWLRRSFQQQYDAAASFVARVLSESPGLRGGSRTSTDDVVTDMAAVRLYLSGGTDRIDSAVRGASVGPHVPLARCVASGLRRLPSYRGATMLRTTLSDAEWEWYGRRRLVTEWGFGSALITGHADLTGDVDVLIWSMTARRTVLLDPAVPDRVFYLPGTSFKVLGAHSGKRRVLLLRELTGPEIGADGSVDIRRLPLDDMAMAGLEQAGTEWQDAQPAERLPATAISALRNPPGLILAGRGPRKGIRRPGAAPSREGTTP